MAVFKNYKIRQNDTLESIAQKQLGSGSYWTKLVSINRLRSPFISDDPIDQLGPAQASLSLSEDLLEGSTSMSMLSYIESQQISPDVLYKGARIFVRTYNALGISVHDEMTIEKYYGSDTAEITKSGSIEIIYAGTVKFTKEYINSPTIPVQYNDDMYPTISNSETIENFSSSNYSPLIYNYPVIKTNIPTSQEYYVRYSYTSKNGETLPSPFVTDENAIQRIPFVRQANRRFAIAPPDFWPSNVEKINVYIGKNPNLLWYQFSFSEGDGPVLENELGIAEQKIDDNYMHPTSYNTAAIGTKYNYYKGMTFTIHQNSDSLKTAVLKTGDILHLEEISQATTNTIQNNYHSTNFVDTLGTDIMLDEFGVIQFGKNSIGDFATVNGVKNVRQALLGRILTKVGDLASFPKYGNPALDYVGERYQIGFLTKIKTAIMQTVVQDERIASIKNLEIYYDPKSSAVIVQNFSIEVGLQGAEIEFVPLPMSV